MNGKIVTRNTRIKTLVIAPTMMQIFMQHNHHGYFTNGGVIIVFYRSSGKKINLGDYVTLSIEERKFLDRYFIDLCNFCRSSCDCCPGERWEEIYSSQAIEFKSGRALKKHLYTEKNSPVMQAIRNPMPDFQPEQLTIVFDGKEVQLGFTPDNLGNLSLFVRRIHRFLYFEMCDDEFPESQYDWVFLHRRSLSAFQLADEEIVKIERRLRRRVSNSFRMSYRGKPEDMTEQDVRTQKDLIVYVGQLKSTWTSLKDEFVTPPDQISIHYGEFVPENEISCHEKCL